MIISRYNDKRFFVITKKERRGSDYYYSKSRTTYSQFLSMAKTGQFLSMYTSAEPAIFFVKHIIPVIGQGSGISFMTVVFIHSTSNRLSLASAPPY